MESVRILIVEDEYLNAAELEHILRSLEYTVAGVTGTGAGAIEMAGSLRPDLILMDIQLSGGVDGITAAARIRAQWDIPVIFISAPVSRAAIEKSRAANPAAYLIKPVTAGGLLAAIETAMDRIRLERELRGSRDEWEKTFDALPDLIAIIDTDHRIVRANRAMAEKMGMSPGDMAGRKCHELMHGSGRPHPFCPHDRLIADGLEHLAEIHEDRLGGDFLLSVSPLRDAAGKVTGSVHVARDITERVRYERALRESRELLEQRVLERTDRLNRMIEKLGQEIEERARVETALRAGELKFRTMVDFTYDWEYWTDPEGNFIYTSPSCERITGYPPEEFIAGREFLPGIIHPDDRDRMISHMRDELLRREPFELDFKLAHRDGSARHIAHACNPVYDTAGAFIGRRCSNRDVTEHRTVELKLREGEEIARALIDTPSEPVMLVAADGTILDANDELAGSLGLPASELIGKSLYRFIRDDSGSPRGAMIRSVVATGGAERFEEKIDDRWYDTIIYPVRNRMGLVEKMAIFSHDITETRRLQKEIMEISEIERQRIGQDLHDSLGQKLTGIAFLAEALRQTMKEKSYPELADMEEIITNITESIDHARKIAGGLWALRFESYDAEQALRELADDTETLFGITCSLRSDLGESIGNAAVVTNLYYITRESINNAIKHGGADTILLRLSDDADRIFLEIRDNGRGAPPEFMNKRGIGMRIMRYRASIIGGEVAVDSAGAGLTVRVTLKKQFISAHLRQ